MRNVTRSALRRQADHWASMASGLLICMNSGEGEDRTVVIFANLVNPIQDIHAYFLGRIEHNFVDDLLQ